MPIKPDKITVSSVPHYAAEVNAIKLRLAEESLWKATTPCKVKSLEHYAALERNDFHMRAITIYCSDIICIAVEGVPP